MEKSCCSVTSTGMQHYGKDLLQCQKYRHLCHFWRLVVVGVDPIMSIRADPFSILALYFLESFIFEVENVRYAWSEESQIRNSNHWINHHGKKGINIHNDECSDQASEVKQINMSV